MFMWPTVAAHVPTTTINLAWHTHQLMPAAYAAHTRALMGHIANHDDSDDVGTEAKIADGAKTMPDVWRAVFDDYYRPNVQAGRFWNVSCHHGGGCGLNTVSDDAGSAIAGASIVILPRPV
ncbi:hypothetical protein AMAG_20280 [Allomyces macrogynus ATCC 38327]|uniref:Uncharacterized protein n=1 Tax=Allomyces macrogynus (strain ATCC 38327) TaxID=578462 RepID=A0A0L0T8L0_ALLM3|nr:hypothetical protein AMAG_20280 [Allomyces macrogynus ATCC 38327]|eukprot:KNE71031.1 hypothetical protein AMAG_20280 [Allomyces macrogynus ATCC 38327]